MKSYSEEYIFANDERWAYEVAKVCVDHVPESWDERTEGRSLIRCHELTRAIAPFVGCEVYDGMYGISEHSWLRNKLWGPGHLLDVYCVGRLPQVQLVDILPTPQVYHAKLLDLRHPVDEALVAKLIQYLNKWTGRMRLRLQDIDRNGETWFCGLHHIVELHRHA